jgi:hypothetical protein
VIKLDVDGSEPLIMAGLLNLVDFNANIVIFMEYCPLMWMSGGHV